MTYPEAIEFLQGLGLFGARLGLDNTRALAARAGDPQQRLRFIHVAGTNGKGSTCAMLESIYRQAGLRVGLFTSPHLVSFSERFQVNREPISESELAALVTEVRAHVGSLDSPVTLFEFATVLALRFFETRGCELVIWETGLGGRLDATNIVTPLASVITNIDFDHQEWLGDTLDQIAAEKAGIIKPRVPVVTAAEPGRGREVIAATARKMEAPLFQVSLSPRALPVADASVVTVEEALAVLGAGGSGEGPLLPLAGEHQRMNAAVALVTVRALAREIAVSDAALRKGMRDLSWPGRMQVARAPGGQTVLLDGAHNPAGAVALSDAVRKEFNGSRPALVLGVLADKDWKFIASTLAPLSDHILLVPVKSQRSLDPALLLPICRGANPEATIEVCASLGEALPRAAEEPFLLITGSLYLVGEAMEFLRLSPGIARPEQGLNEWGRGISRV